MTDDDPIDRIATEAAAALSTEPSEPRALGAVMATARRRRKRRRTLVAVAAVVPIVVGVVWATAGRSHTQQVSSDGPTTTFDPVQKVCRTSSGPIDQLTPLVYVNADATDEQVQTIRVALDAIDVVRSLTYFDHAATLAQAKKLFADEPELLQVLEPEELPTSFEVHFVRGTSAAAADRFWSTVESMPNVYKLDGAGQLPEICQTNPPGSATTTTVIDSSASTTTTVPVPGTGINYPSHLRMPDVTYYVDPEQAGPPPSGGDVASGLVWSESVDRGQTMARLTQLAPGVAAATDPAVLPTSKEYWYRSAQAVRDNVDSLIQDQGLPQYEIDWSDPATGPSASIAMTSFENAFFDADAVTACRGVSSGFDELIYAPAGSTPAQITADRQMLQSLPGVATVTYQDETTTRQRFRATFSQRPDLLALVPTTAFDTAFTVALEPGAKRKALELAVTGSGVYLLRPRSLQAEGLVSLCLGGIDGFVPIGTN